MPPSSYGSTSSSKTNSSTSSDTSSPFRSLLGSNAPPSEQSLSTSSMSSPFRSLLGSNAPPSKQPLSTSSTSSPFRSPFRRTFSPSTHKNDNHTFNMTSCVDSNSTLQIVRTSFFLSLLSLTLLLSYTVLETLIQPNTNSVFNFNDLQRADKSNEGYSIDGVYGVGSSCDIGLPEKGISGYIKIPEINTDGTRSTSKHETKPKTKTEINYFYYFAASRTSPMKNAPLVIWLSGGPGCSSLLASYMENGPCRVTRTPLNTRTHLKKTKGAKNGNGNYHPSSDEDEFELIANRNLWSWNMQNNVLWIDQPPNVGLSYNSHTDSSTNATTTDADANASTEKNKGGKDKHEFMTSGNEVADYILGFLHEWQRIWPDSSNGELYLVAESYGGHYAPAVAHRYLLSELSHTSPRGLKLKGVGVGNGLTNPLIQYQYNADFGYNNSYGVQAFNTSVYEQMKRDAEVCIGMIKKCNRGDDDMCAKSFVYCNEKIEMPYINTGLNIYDIRTSVQYTAQLEDMTNFVNNPNILKALNSKSPYKFKTCNMKVYSKFRYDWMLEYQMVIPYMLDNGISVLIYNGDADYVCNYRGAQAWVNELKWFGFKKYNSAQTMPFKLRDGRVRGEGKSYKMPSVEGQSERGRLSFLRVFNAGHLVPLDQPEAALRMINQFTSTGGVGVEDFENEIL